MAIDPKLVSIKEAKNLPTSEAKSTSDFLFFEDQVLKKSPMSNIYDKVTSGIKGNATQANAPTPYTVEDFPNGLFETYVVRTPLTMPNSWGFAVTQAELDANYVYFDVTDGVITKELSKKTVFDNEVISSYLGDKSLVQNGDFNTNVDGWNVNEATASVIWENGNAKFSTNNTPSSALYQSGNFIAGKKIINLRVFSLNMNSLKIGFVGTTELSNVDLRLGEWNDIDLEINLISDSSLFIIIAPTGVNSVLIDYVKVFRFADNLFTDNYLLKKEIKVLSNDAEIKNWFPTKSNAKSPFYEKLKPFFEKMQLRNQDVTLVQIGDSISTDLNWTDKRSDANERPPFCTEYNVNSYLEEKLRWKEQKYRRFDFAGIFTELGTGTSYVAEESEDWFRTGPSFYLPITKIRDGGTNNGVSFKMLAGIRRLSLIVHSDKNWANSTQVSISGGNGKVQVFNGATWVEANGFSTSFKETTEISTPEGLKIIDNAQKRLKFRSLTDISEKTITVQNVGAGRFAFWGIETSPKEFLFTYVCASKGSHGINYLRIYESFMVDSFAPDLVLQQCCILNQQLGQETRAESPINFANNFESYYNDLTTKGYLVFPYILWAANYSHFIDNNGNFLNGFSSNWNKEFTAFDDVNYLSKMYESKGAPILNLFQRFTEIGLEKATQESGNLYSSALVGSGKNGNTFTIDGIHFNKTGEDVAFQIINGYFNF